MNNFLQVCRSKPFDAIAASFFLIMTFLMVELDAAFGAAVMGLFVGIYLQRLGQTQQKL
jgi:hypothetical protein